MADKAKSNHSLSSSNKINDLNNNNYTECSHEYQQYQQYQQQQQQYQQQQQQQRNRRSLSTVTLISNNTVQSTNKSYSDLMENRCHINYSTCNQSDYELDRNYYYYLNSNRNYQANSHHCYHNHNQYNNASQMDAYSDEKRRQNGGLKNNTSCNKSNSPNYSISIDDIEAFNRLNREDLFVDNSRWLSEKPISVLQLDLADRAVLKIAGIII